MDMHEKERNKSKEKVQTNVSASWRKWTKAYSDQMDTWEIILTGRKK